MLECSMKAGGTIGNSDSARDNSGSLFLTIASLHFLQTLICLLFESTQELKFKLDLNSFVSL